MNLTINSLLVSSVLLLNVSGISVLAHERDDGPKVVPQAERDAVKQQDMQGPTANKGIKSVTPVGSVALAPEFSSTEGKQLRARVITIEPGGVVAIHQHQARPGMAYILEGEIVEHRNDQNDPITRKTGDAAFEKTGVTHWWENKSSSTVRALVVDVVPVDIK